MTKNNKTLLALILALVVVIGGASVLYSRLSGDMAPDQLATQEGSGTSTPAASTPDESQEEPQPVLAPDVTVYDGEGNEVQLADYFGKPLVLNFWASWCGPCKGEMPEFQQKYEELEGEVQFLMLNATGGRETQQSAADFIAQEGYTFPVLYDLTQQAAYTYGAYSLPTTFFIDAKGYVAAWATGAISGDTLQRGIDMAIEQGK